MATEYICYAADDHPYTIVLQDGTSVQLPYTTDDEDVVKELRDFARHHKGFVFVKTRSEYEAWVKKRAEDAAKAAEAEGGAEEGKPQASGSAVVTGIRGSQS